MQFGKWFNRGNTAASQLKKDNPFIGVAVAHQMAGLGELRNIGKLKQALETRQMAKLLGVPPQQIEDEMLAGGDIHISGGSSSGPWPWIALMVIVLSVLGVVTVGSAWFLLRPSPTTVTTPASPTTQSPQPRGQDFIEFYQP